MEELEIYIKIVAFVFPLLIILLTWIITNHFSLKERLKVVEIELSQNEKLDKIKEVNNDKLWGAINEINSTLKKLELDVRVLTENYKK